MSWSLPAATRLPVYQHGTLFVSNAFCVRVSCEFLIPCGPCGPCMFSTDLNFAFGVPASSCRDSELMGWLWTVSTPSAWPCHGSLHASEVCHQCICVAPCQAIPFRPSSFETSDRSFSTLLRSDLMCVATRSRRWHASNSRNRQRSRSASLSPTPSA
eukprot:3870061-Rhodomonas_salina.2